MHYVFERRRRHEPDLTELLGMTIVTLLVPLVILGLITIGLYASAYSDHQDAIKHNLIAERINAISDAAEREREVLFLDSIDQNVQASQGSNWKLTIVEVPEGPDDMAHILYWLLLTFLVTSLFATGYFVIDMWGSYLIDLDWRDPETYFMIVMMFPWGWVLLLCSTIRVLTKIPAAKKAAQEEAARAAERQAQQAPSQARAGTPEEVVFVSDTEKAKTRFIKMCVDGKQANYEEYLDSLREDIENDEDRLKRYAKEIQDTQKSLNENRAKLREKENVVITEHSKAQAENDFEKILSFRGVRGINVNNDGDICIRLDVEVPYEGHLYDFGVWRITLHPQDYNRPYSLLRLRSGLLPDTTGGVNYGTETSFCFGGLSGDIHDLFAQGKYTEALIIMIDSMHHANNPKRIPQTFRRIK